MGNTYSFDIICLWIDEYQIKAIRHGVRLFFTKYNNCYTAKDYITAIKKAHSIPKENSVMDDVYICIWKEMDDEYIRIWDAIALYDDVIAKHNAAITHRDDHRYSFLKKYKILDLDQIRGSIISATRLIMQAERDKEFAERSLAATREARIVAERSLAAVREARISAKRRF